MSISAEMRVLANDLEFLQLPGLAARLRIMCGAVEKLERTVSEIEKDAREDAWAAERRALLAGPKEGEG